MDPKDLETTPHGVPEGREGPGKGRGILTPGNPDDDPVPWSYQVEFLACPPDEAVYGGFTDGGRSHVGAYPDGPGAVKGRLFDVDIP